MGGKTATTTQSVKIPEEVMARYNAVNARAEEVAKQPFQQYQGQFVAPLTQTQQAGIAGTSAAAGTAQPYYQAATQNLMGAQAAATPMYYGALGTAGSAAEQAQNLYGSALGGINQAQKAGQTITGAAMQPIMGAQQASAPLMGAAAGLTGAGLSAAQPYMGAAGGYLAGGTQGVTPGALTGQEINQYMSPYMSNVVGAQQALQAQENAAQRAALSSQQIGRGSFGGERAGLGQANLARQQSLANQATLANLLQSGYGQALGTAQQQQAQQLAAEQANRAAMQFGTQAAGNLGQQAFAQNLAAGQQLANLGQSAFGQNIAQGQALAGLGQQQYGMGLGAAQAQAGLGQNIYGMGAQQAALQQGVGQGLYGMGAQTAQSLAGLGAGAQQAALQGAQAQIGAGTLEQQTQQAQDTAKYQQFLQERGYPFQVAQFLANIAMGTGALSGSTTTTTQPAPFFSDVRLKDDVEPVGELYDGQKVYRYSMGDGPKQLGLLAQEVENVRPDAVGESSGFKTVDYDRATSDAAGLGAAASMGGAVTGPGEYAHGGLIPRHGYALSGAVVDPSDLSAILASQAQSFGPFSPAGLYGGSPMGAPFSDTKGAVPAAKLPSPKLVTAGSLPSSSSKTGLAQAVNDIEGTIGTGKKLVGFAVGREGTRDNPKGEAGLFGAGGKFSSEDNLFQRGKEWLGFEYGGLVPRQGYALKGMVDPYDPIKDMSKGIGEQFEEDIESQNDPNSLQKPGQMPGAPKSGISQIGEAAGTAMTLAKLGQMAMAFLPSDARLKDNIRPVGETYDGQNIYAYDMGDGRTRIGLMAQEVLKRHPEAVGERNGYLTLDYDRATGEATPYAYGGLVPRQGYATEGGVEEEADLPARGATAMESVARQPTEEDILDRAAAVTRQKESGNNYGIVGPVISSGSYRGDRPYGAYQVMGKNVGPWTEKYLGQRMTPEEFLGDKQAQDKLFKAAWGENYRKYGNAADAASIWASGVPLAKGAERRDLVFGTRVGDYVNDFMQKMSGQKFNAPPRPPGLVPGEERRVAGAEYVKGKEEPSMFDKISEKATSRDFLVPALSFVGSMLSSKSPYLAGAIGEGIVGGVAGYQSNLKQQADLAKSVLDIVKDRFVIRSENGRPVYFNKNTGQKLNAQEYNDAIVKLGKAMGVPPAVFGLDEGQAARGLPQAIGATPAIGGPSQAGVQPQTVSAPDAAKPGEPAKADEVTKPGEPAKTTEAPKPKRDLFKMSQGQLAVYAENNPEEFDLTGPRDPRKLRAEEEGYLAEMKNATAQGNEQEAQRMAMLMKDARDRREKYISEAIDKQYKDNLEIQKASTQRGEEYRAEINKRMQDYSQVRNSLVRLSNIYSKWSPSRLAELKADLASWAGDLGIKLPENFNTASYDEALKIATSQAFGIVGDKNLSRSPKAAMTYAAQTVPGPNLAPGAVYALIGRTIGEMDYVNARDRDYLKRGRGTTPEDFIMDYDKASGNSEKKFIGKAFEEIPVGRDVLRRDLDSLAETYKFGRTSGDERSDQGQAAIPPVDQRETGKVYTVPGKGEYRWMGTGWQKVGQ